jgi:dipeptidase E
MKLLLTSSGISNQRIQNALTGLLGKPITESNALFVPTGMYPFPSGPQFAWKAMNGQVGSAMCQLGWKSLGLFELTVLPGIEKEVWRQTLREADALLVWGGDPVFLGHWLRESGLADLLPTLNNLVYVGVSAGAMATSKLFGESYSNPPTTIATPLTIEDIHYDSFNATLMTARGAGFIDFAIIPHYRNENHQDASEGNARIWASKIDGPVYAIDDQTAIKVEDNDVEVISEGHWHLF